MVIKGYFDDSRSDGEAWTLAWLTWPGSTTQTTGLLTVLCRPRDKFAVPLSEQDFEPLAGDSSKLQETGS
jgi:hypothetical protein